MDSNYAEKHTQKVTKTELEELWAKVATRSEKTGDEVGAIQEVNSVIARQREAALAMPYKSTNRNAFAKYSTRRSRR